MRAILTVSPASSIDAALATTQAQEADLLEFLAAAVELSARTKARRLSALRRYYQYLVRERLIANDPSLRLSGPRLGRGFAEGHQRA